ncbi:coenzyme Q-binding protein COQ10 homolog B, mitochondrial-like [Abrus precatorius]|uniref:Coenzyme Q-binding protein COQ10 homolog B, mitochondrial-like n=1 Tax=Abrus precatorius TaxID=3816 RepID=A0A8B8MHV6_ABRPR|nr:coenzyme Q-binding protein COQ10 homolog B, mitochondrial-like [Abrus precatorius]
MPPFLSSSNALRSLASRKRNLTQFIISSNECLTRIPTASFNNAVQTRQFLGRGNGDQGVLSKIYEEKRVLGYSQEQLFDVVAAVDLYHGFVPWCLRSEIIKHYQDGSFDAELEIGFKFLVESYVSRVELNKPKLIKTTVSKSTLFDHLINIWEFSPGPVPGTCNLYFLVDFKFQSPLYRQIASMFFKEVASRMVSSFHERCHLIYGPEVPEVDMDATFNILLPSLLAKDLSNAVKLEGEITRGRNSDSNSGNDNSRSDGGNNPENVSGGASTAAQPTSTMALPMLLSPVVNQFMVTMPNPDRNSGPRPRLGD